MQQLFQLHYAENSEFRFSQFSSVHIFISHIQQKNYSLIKNKIQDLIYR